MDQHSDLGGSEHNPSLAGKHCQKAGGEPCTACQRLIALDAEHTAARMALVSRINEHHDPFILRLPIELASRIFTHCIPYPASLHAFSTLEDEADREYEQPIPFILASVSSQWRHIALATPQLWNIISLNIEEGDRAPHPFMIDAWLRRSGVLPLYIRIFCAEEPEPDGSLDPLINYLNQESHRWKVLDLNLPRHLFSRFNGSSTVLHANDVLVRLKLFPVAEDEDTYDMADDLPVSFRLHTKPFPKYLTISTFSLSMISVGWSRLTNFDASFIILNDCMLVMQYSPSLERCTLEEVICGDDESELPIQHLTHRNLSYLDVFRHMPHFLSFFTFPSLKELHFDASNTPPPDIEDFLRRSRVIGTLDAFTISNHEYTAEFRHSDLYQLLKATPSLTRLAIIETPITGGFFGLFATSSGQNPFNPDDEFFLPQLRHLRIKGDRDFEWPSVRAVLPSNTEENHPVSHLALDKLELEMRGSGLIDEAVLQAMQAARGKGIKVRVIDSQGQDLIRKSRLHYAKLGQT